MANFDISMITWDPLSKFGGKNTKNPRIREACGLLPFFALQGPGPMAWNMEKNYNFFYGWSIGSTTVTEDGVHHYPGDPDMYPLCRIDAVTEEGQKETIFIYDHAMVAHMLDGEFQGSTRMD
jgi:hypothetical protein